MTPHEHATHGGHDKHAGHSVEMFRRKFWGTLVLTIPTLLWAPMLQTWLHFSAPLFPGSKYIPALFGTLVFAYGGVPFLQMAVPELKNRQPGMMTLISLAISVALIYSVAVFFPEWISGGSSPRSWRSWCSGTGSRCPPSRRRKAR